MDTTLIVMVLLFMLVIIGIGCFVFLLLEGRRMNRDLSFEESKKEISNPLSGYAPPAELGEVCRDFRLVYIALTWAMWEPSPGGYDIRAVESQFHIRQWKEEGKHAVLRFFCDVPGKKLHIDIPEWLYQRTGDGEFYNISLGAGYSPDYSNTTFRKRHKRAVTALATYCAGDSFVSYVELGSLGHGGEWHTCTDEGVPPLPDREICREYALIYLEKFRHVHLLMSRNFRLADTEGLGLYNAGASVPEVTMEWLAHTRRSGRAETGGSPLACSPMKHFWEDAPAGGHLSPGENMERSREQLRELFSLVRNCHLTYLSTGLLFGKWKDSAQARRLERLLGYRYFISRLRIRRSLNILFPGELAINMVWENSGAAPLYWDLSAVLYIFDLDGKTICMQEVDVDLHRLLPGSSEETVTYIPVTEEMKEGYQLGVRITDPEDRETVELAMDMELQDGVQVIYVWENWEGETKGGN